MKRMIIVLFLTIAAYPLVADDAKVKYKGDRCRIREGSVAFIKEEFGPKFSRVPEQFEGWSMSASSDHWKPGKFELPDLMYQVRKSGDVYIAVDPSYIRIYLSKGWTKVAEVEWGWHGRYSQSRSDVLKKAHEVGEYSLPCLFHWGLGTRIMYQ